MTVVHLVISGDVAGGQLVALQLAQAARARGDRVTFVSPARGPFVDRVREEGFEVALIDVSRLFHLGGLLRLVRFLRSERADIVHTHAAVAANSLGRVAGRLAGAAVVSHMHIENHFRPNPVARALYRRLDNATARLSARILVVSESTRAGLERQGYRRDRMEVVHNGIEPAGRGRPLRAELGLPQDGPLIGEIARLCDVKGQRELIQALARLDRPDLRVVLIGDDLETGGAFRAALEHDAERLGVRDRVVFAGPRAAAAELLGDLDAFVLPSWVEGLPMVVLEAMARGRPVVATAVGGTPEVVVDGETGLLVAPRDPDALARAIGTLLDDPERARTMGDAGARRVREHFSAAAMQRRVLAVYDQVAGRGS